MEETECFINKKVMRKNDTSLFPQVYVVIDTFYIHAVKFAGIVLPENEYKVRGFKAKNWKKLIEHEYCDKLQVI